MKALFKGEELRHLREDRGVSLSELSRLSGVSKASIGNFETSARGMSIKAQRSIASALGLQADECASNLKPPRRVSLQLDTKAGTCAGCVARDAEIAYLQGVVADQAQSLRDANAAMLQLTSGVCRYPAGAEGPSDGGTLRKTG